jgi:uronate dehydrogenase
MKGTARYGPGMLGITGAAGYIGGVLRRGLVTPGEPVRLLDRVPMSATHPGEQLRSVELADLDGLAAALAGVDCVVHLAALGHEAEFAVITEQNIVGTQHLFEAATRAGVRRVAFASSIHVNGFHPVTAALGLADPVRPDTFYGVSKLFGEQVGRLYADKHGLEVVCLRICTCSPEPTDHQGLATWLSPGDTIRLFRAATTAPDLSYVIAYGVSANTRRLIADDNWAVLGYVPVDDAEVFADRVPPPTADERRFLGAGFAERV